MLPDNASYHATAPADGVQQLDGLNMVPGAIVTGTQGRYRTTSRGPLTGLRPLRT
jgi:hypothetical protein